MPELTRTSRAGEAGLTLIEALVVIILTAVLASVLLPVLIRSSRANVTMAESAVDAGAQARVGRQFQMLLATVRPDTLEGGTSVLRAVNLGPQSGRCGRGRWIVLQIARRSAGAALVCDGEELVHWRGGTAAFAYSVDGGTWSPTWEPPRARGGSERLTTPSPLVRLDWGVRGGRDWIARAGAVLPAPDAEPASAAQGVER